MITNFKQALQVLIKKGQTEEIVTYLNSLTKVQDEGWDDSVSKIPEGLLNALYKAKVIDNDYLIIHCSEVDKMPILTFLDNLSNVYAEVTGQSKCLETTYILEVKLNKNK